MKEIRLKVAVREDSGKKSSRRIRREGTIPGIIYGHKENPVNLAVPQHEFRTILHHATSEHLILTVDIEGMANGPFLSLVKAVQHHPVTGNVMHVDFQRISKDETIEVGVPVVLKGIPKGVKDLGGILDHGLREVMISTIPSRIPESVEVDVSAMEIGNSIHLSDLIEKYPDLVFVDDPVSTIAHVSPPKKLEPTAEEAAAAAAAAAAPAEGEAPAEAAEGGEES